jgi:hypothetical protein
VYEAGGGPAAYAGGVFAGGGLGGALYGASTPVGAVGKPFAGGVPFVWTPLPFV